MVSNDHTVPHTTHELEPMPLSACCVVRFVPCEKWQSSSSFASHYVTIFDIDVWYVNNRLFIIREQFYMKCVFLTFTVSCSWWCVWASCRLHQTVSFLLLLE